MPVFDLVIENGTVVNSRGAFEGKVAVKNGRIAALLAGEGGKAITGAAHSVDGGWSAA